MPRKLTSLSQKFCAAVSAFTYSLVDCLWFSSLQNALARLVFLSRAGRILAMSLGRPTRSLRAGLCFTEPLCRGVKLLSAEC